MEVRSKRGPQKIFGWSRHVGRSLVVVVVIAVSLSLLGLRKSSLVSLRHLNHIMQDNAGILLSFENLTVANNSTAAAAAVAVDDDASVFPVVSVSVGQNRTKIIAASDYAYKDMALAWYESLTKLGYTTHMILAMDEKTANVFRERGLRHDILLPPAPAHSRDDDARREGDAASSNNNFCYQEQHQQKQWHRRVIFGMRWHYVLGQLEQGYHVLLTDVDNIFVRHYALSNMEDAESKFDVFHAYAMAYPANVYEKLGYTVCGCLTWLRSSPGSINFVQALLNRCRLAGTSGSNSTSNGMKCYACDDQVEVNKLYLGYQQSSMMTLDVPDDFSKQGFWKSSISGRVNSTNHKFYLWDSDLAYRGPIRGIEGRCPGQSINSTHDTARSANWMAAPTTSTSTRKGLDGVQERKARLEDWNDTCGSNNRWWKAPFR
jgi:Nucleotide-diphospho-sugar transferase